MSLSLKISPRLFQDWRIVFTLGLTIGYIALLSLFVAHSEELWRTVVLFLGGGAVICAQWHIARQYLSLEKGYLEMRPKFPFFLIAEKKQRIDLSKMNSAVAAIHAIGYYTYRQHAVPAIVFTVNGLQPSIFGVPLPFGRNIEDPEVQSFVEALNNEIHQQASSKEKNLA